VHERLGNTVDEAFAAAWQMLRNAWEMEAIYFIVGDESWGDLHLIIEQAVANDLPGAEEELANLLAVESIRDSLRD
jgi:hypothetical protein